MFFPGLRGSAAAIVDPATWTVSPTPDLGIASGGTGQAAYDGDSIYVIAQDEHHVLRVDSATFTVSYTIEPLGVNAVLVDDGALWVAKGQPYDIAQRFDF